MQWVNDSLGGVVAWVREQPGVALLVLLILQIALLALALTGWLKASRLAKRQARMLRGAAGDSLEQMLLDYADGSAKVQSRLESAYETGVANTDAVRKSLRRIGLVRYDAFPNIGGRQSFSLALLDDGNSGLLLTSLVSRQDARLYAKPIAVGQSASPLSDEEREALRRARIACELETGE